MTNNALNTAASLEQKIAAWARAIIADRAPVKGGFAPAPLFPVTPVPLTSEAGHE